MNGRFFPGDYVRVFAMIMILLCHYYQNCNLASGVDRYLGDVGNMIFFLLSAFLYGGKLNSDKMISKKSLLNYKQFVVKRFVKLASSIWPFLMTIVGLYILYNVSFSWGDVGLNFLLLGYLGKLPGNGHLWFLTILFVCYIEYVLFDRIRIKSTLFPYLFLMLMFVIMVIAETINFPGNAFAVFGLYGFVLLKQNIILRKSRNIRKWIFVLIILLNIMQFYLEIQGLFVKSRIFHYLLSDTNGFLLLCLLINIMPDIENKIISWISGISFEIYIVHYTLCAGPFIHISSLTEYHIFNFLTLVALSVFFAYILNLISQKLYSLIIVTLLR